MPLDEFAAHPVWVAYVLVAFTVVIVAVLIAADIRAAKVRRSRPFRHSIGAVSPSDADQAGTVEPISYRKDIQ